MKLDLTKLDNATRAAFVQLGKTNKWTPKPPTPPPAAPAALKAA